MERGKTKGSNSLFNALKLGVRREIRLLALSRVSDNRILSCLHGDLIYPLGKAHELTGDSGLKIVVPKPQGVDISILGVQTKALRKDKSSFENSASSPLKLFRVLCFYQVGTDIIGLNLEVVL